jgi:glycosyltransferase involved in cell wall biosynthesis
VQPAKIGIDVTSAVVQGGGIGRYTRELVRAVVAADRVNEFTLFSSRWPDRLPVPDPLPSGPNVRKRAAPVSDRWLYRLWYRLRLPVPVQWLTGPLDLFHSPDFVLPPVRRGVPTLLTVHDLSFVHYPEAFTPALLRYLHTAVPRSIAQCNAHPGRLACYSRRPGCNLAGTPGEDDRSLQRRLAQFRPIG